MNPKVVDCKSSKNISIKLQTCAKHVLLSSMSNNNHNNNNNNNNENFIEFFMHLQLKISLLKVIYNWLLDTLYITTFT